MWNAVKWLLLYIVVQFLIIFGFTFVYMANGNDPNLFGNFLNDNKIILVLLLGLIFIPLYLYKYKKFDIKEKSFDITKLIIFVVFLSVGYNILAYYLDKYVLLSGLYSNTSNILVGIISTVLLGPIIEELLFRGVIYNNLKLKYSIKKSMIITTILFSLSHFTLIQIIYTLIFGMFLNKVYEKYQNIKYVIILHMVSNLVTTLISLFIIKDYFIVNIILLIVSILYLLKNKELFG